MIEVSDLQYLVTMRNYCNEKLDELSDYLDSEEITEEESNALNEEIERYANYIQVIDNTLDSDLEEMYNSAEEAE